MFKAVGLGIILISCAGAGFAFARELTQRLCDLEMMLQVSLLLKGEIQYGNASLYDAFTAVAGKMKGKYREFLLSVSEEMKVQKGEPFSVLFQRCARTYFEQSCLCAQEKEKLYSLGERLGYLGVDMQMKQLTLFEKELEFSIENLQKELPARMKIYRSLGILSGVLLMVVLW